MLAEYPLMVVGNGIEPEVVADISEGDVRKPLLCEKVPDGIEVTEVVEEIF